MANNDPRESASVFVQSVLLCRYGFFRFKVALRMRPSQHAGTFVRASAVLQEACVFELRSCFSRVAGHNSVFFTEMSFTVSEAMPPYMRSSIMLLQGGILPQRDGCLRE